MTHVVGPGPLGQVGHPESPFAGQLREPGDVSPVLIGERPVTGTGREPNLLGQVRSFKYAHRCVIRGAWIEWDSEMAQGVCDCMVAGKHVYRARFVRYLLQFLQVFRRPLVVRVYPGYPFSADQVQKSLADDADTLTLPIIKDEDTVRLEGLSHDRLEST